MSSPSLPTYLNDHLAGSVIALEMLDHLITAHEKSPLGPWLVSIRADVQTDQDTLKKIIKAVGASESTGRQAVAWTMEKFAWLKLEISNLQGYGLLLALESLVLGITGKRGLWEILAGLTPPPAGLSGFRFPDLIARADAQAAKVNQKRLDVGSELLIASPEAALVQAR